MDLHVMWYLVELVTITKTPKARIGPVFVIHLHNFSYNTVLTVSFCASS